MQGIIFDWIGTLYVRDKGLFHYTEKVIQNVKQTYKLGLVSIASKGIEIRKREIGQSGIAQYFDSIIIDTAKTPEHYVRCMAQMGTRPQATKIIDDRMKRGIKIGNQLGCETYWIQKGEYAHELPDEETGEPTHKIDSIQDLLKLL